MKILLADDHQLFAGGFSLILKNVMQDSSTTQVSSWMAAHSAVQKEKFDLIVVDLFMPSDSSDWRVELAELTSYQGAGAVCIISSSMSRNDMYKAFELGAKGYIHKSGGIDEIKCAMDAMLEGRVYFPPQMRQQMRPAWSPNSKLTVRQQEILIMIAEGQRNSEIATTLGIMESTIKRHVYNICQQLDVKNRTEAVYQARQTGIINN